MTILGHKIPETDLEEISKYLEPLTLKKGDVFIKQDEHNNTIGVMIDGLMVATYESDKGKTETSKIYCLENNNNIVSNHESFINGTKSNETIKAIEETKLMIIDKQALNQICSLYPKFEKLVRVATEKSYLDATEQLKKFRSYNAKERIADYYTKNKKLFNRIDKQVLASYLGVNRNDFSKYLGQINRNE